MLSFNVYKTKPHFTIMKFRFDQFSEKLSYENNLRLEIQTWNGIFYEWFKISIFKLLIVKEKLNFILKISRQDYETKKGCFVNSCDCTFFLNSIKPVVSNWRNFGSIRINTFLWNLNIVVWNSWPQVFHAPTKGKVQSKGCDVTTCLQACNRKFASFLVQLWS